MDLFLNSIDRLRQLLIDKKKLAILIHCNPDGDAMGSALALKQYFELAGHEVAVVSPNLYPDYFEWMPGVKEMLVFQNQIELVTNQLNEADIIFGVDFNDWSRVNKLSKLVEAQHKTKVIIDHHPNPSSNLGADFVYSCTKVSSAAEIVYEFMLRLNLAPLNKEIASCIFTGMMTDTGNFSYNDSNPRTYSIISELSEYEIDKEKIRRSLFQIFSFDRMRLKGFALSQRMRFFPKSKTAYIWLTKKDLADYHFKLGDTEGFVNLPLSIKDVYFSVLFIENDDKIKMSLRSKGNFDVNIFARNHFEGGGHLNAAGGRSYKGMEKTLQKFEKLIDGYATEISNSYSYE